MPNKNTQEALTDTTHGAQPSKIDKIENLDAVKYVRELLSKEIQFRRDRTWGIFAWTSNILVGIIGGVIAVNSSDRGFAMSNSHKLLLCSAVIIVAGFSNAWIGNYTKKEQQLRMRANELDLQHTGIRLHSDGSRLNASYRVAVPLLAIAAILAIVLVHKPSAGAQQPTPVTPAITNPK